MVQKIKSSNLDADILTGNTELAEAANNADTVLVHDTSAGTLKKIQVSNLTAQAGDGLAKTNSTLAVDIPNTTLLDTGAATNDEVLIYDTSASALRSITQTNLLNFPTVSSVSPTNVASGDGTGNHTFVITGVGFTGSSASLINASGSSIAFDTVTVDSNTQITGVIAKSSLPNSGEPYDVRVSAATGLQSTLENQINIDAQPVFSTAAGSLGTIADGARASGTVYTIAAADPESGGDVVYTIESGSIPAGMSFASTSSGATISGTPDAQSSNTTSNFTIRAKDVNSNTSDRAFSITVNAPQYQSFTSSGTFTVPTGLTSVDVLVVAGGGGGGREAGGGGGAGGLIYRPGFTVTPGATVTVTVGCGGAGIGACDPAPGAIGQDSVFGTLTAKGGGGGVDGGGAGQPGGSGAGSHGNGQAAGGSATQPTQPGESGNYGFGNAGGSHTSPNTANPGGGGGGAGAAGSDSNAGSVGDGGVGKAYTISDGTTSVYYAGGGGGGGRSQSAGTGGQGGAGTGGRCSPINGTAATANRGGGGGGGSGGGAPGGGGGLGGAGGKGIVIVKY